MWVNDKLPEEFIDVLIYEHDTIKLAHLRDRKFVDESYSIIQKNVTHWHSLPNPPAVNGPVEISWSVTGPDINNLTE